MRFAHCLLLLVALLSGQGSTARAQPVPGVVWERPADRATAVEDLRQMAAMGIRAVRTGPVLDARLYAWADSLGLVFYQDLPLRQMPAARLADSLASALGVLDALLSPAARYASARYLGLATWSDTASPRACAAIDSLAGRARGAGPEGLRLYYATGFVESDRCAGAVDAVLLDARGADAPQALLERWGEAHPEGPPAGIGALGVGVRPSAEGLNMAGSPERQARYLEEHLPGLLSGERADAIFIYRWRDAEETPRVPGAEAYGLFMAGGEARPAAEVVEGVLTGRQLVFAFAAGRPARPAAPWIVLLGWGALLALGAFYAGSPQFRLMVPRYFRAVGFYRQGIREGRDALWGSATVLIASLAIADGIVAAVLLKSVQGTEAFAYVYGWLPPGLRAAGAGVLARPAVLVLLLAGVQAASAFVWSVVLSVASRRRGAFLTPAQALLLIGWPRWTMLLLMVAALVVATLAAPQVALIAPYLAGAWVVAHLYATLRTTVDYVAVSRVRWPVAFLAACARPTALLGLLVLVVLLERREEVALVWRLITRP